MPLVIICCLYAAPALAATEYSVQSTGAAGHPISKFWWEPWCGEITQKSGGRVVFNFYGAGALVKAEAVPTALRNGVVDIAGIMAQNSFAMLPYSQALALPFLAQDAAQACVLYSKMYETLPEMRAEIDKNYKLLWVMGSDRFAFISTNGLIKTPGDLKGRRVLVWSAGQIDEVKAWGGIPQQISMHETYMALQRGLGEVAYVAAPSIEAHKLSEVAGYITIIPSHSLPMLIAMNWESWRSLPPDVQRVVEESTGPALSKRVGEFLVSLTDADLDKIRNNGGQVHVLSMAEQQNFKQAAAEANRKYWLEALSRNGVENPAAYIKKVERLAAETFGGATP